MNYIEANEIFSMAIHMIKENHYGHNKVEFVASYEKDCSPEFFLYIIPPLYGPGKFGIKKESSYLITRYGTDLNDFSNYLIYGLHDKDCEGFYLIPTNHNNFLAIVEDILEQPIDIITHGHIHYLEEDI